METMTKPKTKKVDLRVKKTKRLIRNSVAALLKEKDVDSITVKEVAELADINRKTFYNYYANVSQVVDEIENEIVDTFCMLMKDLDLQTILQNPLNVFQKLIDVLNQDPDLYTNLIHMNGNLNLINRIADEIKLQTKEIYADQTSLRGERLDIVLEFLYNGIFYAFRKWLHSEQTLSLEEVSGDIGRLAVGGLGAFVKA